MNNYIDYVMNNVTCRFESVADHNLNDDRFSLNLPNTDLHVNFIIYTNENTINVLKNAALKSLNISAEELLEIALSNTYRKERPQFLDLKKITGIANTAIEDDIRNIIVSNENLYYGAVLILHKKVHDEIYKKLGDFYILPSSVHEVICVPKVDADKEYLLKMVKEVNSEYFMTDIDILTDDVFEIRDGKICSAFINSI